MVKTTHLSNDCVTKVLLIINPPLALLGSGGILAGNQEVIVRLIVIQIFDEAGVVTEFPILEETLI